MEGSALATADELFAEPEIVNTWTADPALQSRRMSEPPQLRHPALVRVTHWLTALAFLALLVTGVEVLISHPRFYWGETGNVNTRPLFSIPIPSSRDLPTGYDYVLPDQNGWSRYLHFEAAWLATLTGLVYLAFGLFAGHFRRNLMPSLPDVSPRHLAGEIDRKSTRLNSSH